VRLKPSAPAQNGAKAAAAFEAGVAAQHMAAQAKDASALAAGALRSLEWVDALEQLY
jgi:hypothetical protein